MMHVPHLVCLLFLLLTGPWAAQAQGYAPPVALPGNTTVVPVCNRMGTSGEGGVTSGGYPQSNSRYVLVCPRGARTIELMYPGITSASQETDLTAQIPIHAGLQIVSAACTINNNCPVVPVTFGGARAGLLAVNADGVLPSYLLSDSVAVNVPAGGQIVVTTYVNQAANAPVSYGRTALAALGEGGQVSATGNTDCSTLANCPKSLQQGAWYHPVAVLGIPQTSGPTACIIGDSISVGYQGTGASTAAVNAGGSGYVAGDVGKLVTVSGATYPVAVQPQILIAAVSGGAVTTVSVASPGAYNLTGTTSYTGASTAGGGTAGSGLTVNLTLTNVIEAGDAAGNQGFLERALAAAGVPWMRFSKAGDRTAYWIARDYGRMAMMRAIHCSSAIVELDVNDVTASTAAAAMQANDVTLWRQIAAFGTRVFATTTTPGGVQSTDLFATTDNQTPPALDANRIALNNWKRCGAPIASAANPTPAACGAAGALLAGQAGHPLTGVFDVADQVESARNSGKFYVNGNTPGLCAIDGTHLAPACITRAQAGVRAGMLQ